MGASQRNAQHSSCPSPRASESEGVGGRWGQTGLSREGSDLCVGQATASGSWGSTWVTVIFLLLMHLRRVKLCSQIFPSATSPDPRLNETNRKSLRGCEPASCSLQTNPLPPSALVMQQRSFSVAEHAQSSQPLNASSLRKTGQWRELVILSVLVPFSDGIELRWLGALIAVGLWLTFRVSYDIFSASSDGIVFPVQWFCRAIWVP